MNYSYKTITFCIAFMLTTSFFMGCDKKANPSQRKYEDSYRSGTTATSTKSDRSFIDNSLSTGNSPYQKETSSVENDPYYNNSLSSGAAPYTNTGSTSGNDSQIRVTTSGSSNCDVVVIIKNGGRIVKNAYIKAGDSYTFNVSNGTYQVFFYGGKGWNPNKSMPNGLKGGFVANESYSKDTPVSLTFQELTYELIPQHNGNFSTMPSNESEIF